MARAGKVQKFFLTVASVEKFRRAANLSLARILFPGSSNWIFMKLKLYLIILAVDLKVRVLEM